MSDTAPPKILDLPIGIHAAGKRRETDSMGEIEVPADHYWGAQTERSLIHFSIGNDRMPKELYHAYGYVKKAGAIVNAAEGLLPQWKADLISRVCDEVISGQLDDEFPLFVFQTGSGTQSNMNVNEVISNRAIQLVGGKLGSKKPIHPNDDVNMSQSSNDTFPTAMHIAIVLEFPEHLLPSITTFRDTILAKARQWVDVVKIGRTHLQDATPMTVGQEWSGYAAQLDDALAILRRSMEGLYRLAMGGTAVGTGINAPEDFGERSAAEISRLTGHRFITAPNKFAAIASLDAMLAASSALRGLAVVLMKIANDLRWLGSGPRAGIHELILPDNEPGSSIMPGKVNPTQEEAVIMACIQVIGEDNTVSFAASQGNFELNTMRPIIIDNVLHGARILGDCVTKLREFSINKIKLDSARIDRYVRESLMLVTALSPVIGYDKAAAIAHQAMVENTTLREAALKSGYINGEDFDRIVVPKKMVGNPRKDLGMDDNS
ncbi:MAG TPA: class II fumarate hydratase [Nitrososphaerales archaeon]|nr:class II fumarate hydratase [Nitrososphaerales archaeon]